VNLNMLARDVALIEGGKVSLSIAQVKEVMRILLEALAALPGHEVERVLRRYRR
jgi:hypothetical protein